MAFNKTYAAVSFTTEDGVIPEYILNQCLRTPPPGSVGGGRAWRRASSQAECAQASHFAGPRRSRRKVPALVGSARRQLGVDRREARKGRARLREFQRELPAAADDARGHGHQFLDHGAQPAALRRVPDRRVLADEPFEPDPAQDVVGQHRARHDEIVGRELARRQALDVEVGLELGMELLRGRMIAVESDDLRVRATADGCVGARQVHNRMDEHQKDVDNGVGNYAGKGVVWDFEEVRVIAPRVSAWCMSAVKAAETLLQRDAGRRCVTQSSKKIPEICHKDFARARRISKAFIDGVSEGASGKLFKVRVGGFPTKEAAESGADRLHGDGHAGTWVVRLTN